MIKDRSNAESAKKSAFADSKKSIKDGPNINQKSESSTPHYLSCCNIQSRIKK